MITLSFINDPKPGDERSLEARLASFRTSGARIFGLREVPPEVSHEEPAADTQCHDMPRDDGIEAKSFEEMVSTAVAAAVVHATVDTMRRWRSKRRGPPWVQIGNRNVKYRRRDLEDFLASRRVDVNQPAMNGESVPNPIQTTEGAK